MADQTLPEILFDKRLQERFIRQGLLTPQQLEERLGKLEDVSDKAEACNDSERHDKVK